MKLVVDANIIFAALIKEGKTVELLFNPEYDLLSPAYLLEELIDHTEEILVKTKRSVQEFEEFLIRLRKRITLYENIYLWRISNLQQK